MKGLVLKDIFGIKSFLKGTLMSIIIISVCFFFSVGTEGIIAAVAIICATMIVTTYTLDERYGWQKFAMAMPVSAKQYVGAKYIVNLIFCTAGVAIGAVIALLLQAYKHAVDIPALLAVCAAALGICLLFGAFIIPLLTYFGVEKARLIMMGVIAIPTVLAYVVLDKVDLSSMVFTDAQVKLILAGVIAAVILIVLLSYLISVKIFRKKEF